MNSSALLRKSLRTLATDFPSIRLRYQLDEFTRTHMVEVSPAYLYDADDNFKGAQAKVIDAFVQNFPDEGLCFIGPNDVIAIEVDAEVFHGFWSEVQVVEPLSFAWPLNLIPAAFHTQPTSWREVFSLSPSRNMLHSPIFIKGFISQSFTVHIPLVSFEMYDAAIVDVKKEDKHCEELDYALAA